MPKLKHSKASVFYAGLSGLVLPLPRYRFPPPYDQSSRLTYYSTIFNSIEINSSFYKLPLFKTIQKWGEQVPVNFKFTFKLWKAISHTDNLDFSERDIKAFFEAISAVKDKKGCVLIQFPPALGSAHLSRLTALLQELTQQNKNGEWKIAIEFRNKTWYQPEVYDLLTEFNVTMVIHDMNKAPSPMITTADHVYIRFHGPEPRYRGSYSEHFLSEYASFVREWMEEGKAVFCYFNNTMGDAYRNQQTLINYVHGK